MPIIDIQNSDALPATPLTSPDGHAAPWSGREELERDPEPRRWQAELNPQADDGRCRNGVRDTCDIIAFILKRKAARKRLRGALTPPNMNRR